MEKNIEGARVCLVGGLGDPPIPDGYDLVVRCNNNIKHQPGRLDILYHHGAFKPRALMHEDKRLLHLKACVLNTVSPKAGLVREFMLNHGVNLIEFESPYTRTLEPNRGTPWVRNFRLGNGNFDPFMGVLALHHLLLSGAKRVYVTGMDCQKSKLESGIDHYFGSHSVEKNKQAMINLGKDSRVIYDSVLQRGLE